MTDALALALVMASIDRAGNHAIIVGALALAAAIAGLVYYVSSRGK